MAETTLVYCIITKELLTIKGECIMPRGNGTGPTGQGPKTGRGMGNCNNPNVNSDQTPNTGIFQNTLLTMILNKLGFSGGSGQGRGGGGWGSGRKS